MADLVIHDSTWTVEAYQEAIEEITEEIHYHLKCYDGASSKVNAGYHLQQLQDNISALGSWHRGYDYNSGTLPYEREDD